MDQNVQGSGQGEPEGTQAPGQVPGTQQRESQSERLRRQRDSARGEVNALRNDVNSLKEMMAGISGQLSNLQSGKNGSAGNWDDLSEEQLFSYAVNEEVASTKPHIAINAAIRLAEKKMASQKDKWRQEILNEVLGKVQRSNDNQAVLSRISRDFGQDALNQDSDLFQLANERYIAYQNKYGADKVNELQEYKYWAVKEAAEELGLITPKGNQANNNPGAESMPPKKIQGPPAGLMTEGSSVGTADRIAERQSMLDKGNWKGAIRTLSKAFFE